MKWISSAPSEIPPKDDKLADKVARCTPKVYVEKYDIVELEEWIRRREKIFTVVEVPDEKQVNIGMFYLIEESDIWWNTVKDKMLRSEFTWSKFLEN